MKTAQGRLIVIGEIFGRWTVKEYWGANKYHNKFWICVCECGTEKRVGQGVLRNGQSKSCGCLQAENLVKRLTKHGRSRDPIYSVWRQMIQRCNNNKNTAYPKYGGRGIKIEDDRWLKFENFLEDMGDRPTAKHSIDRINNYKGYCKENCRWATPSQQVANRGYQGRYKHLEFEGRLLSIPDWAKKYNTTEEVIRGHLTEGISVDYIFTKLLSTT
jgi:hypothetical protein